ncbi:helix-turn-helix domain-containing protein [Halomonas sp.]|uniref:helix-turn-helix domain-containing protein n=1 Tax=Halomonas sp. TaxID=1486246 RepID=UPI00298DCBB8|nr:helix-turn-helix domain-containing protein [Halomonas sp.]MDW7748905.1 helix-turn-helix domain-containing protein [Halomonas sp.]
MIICYSHLTAETRLATMMMQATHSVRAIATHLGRASRTVSRGMARHTAAPSRGATMAAWRTRSLST